MKKPRRDMKCLTIQSALLPSNALDIETGQERSLIANDSSHFLDGALLVSKGM